MSRKRASKNQKPFRIDLKKYKFLGRPLIFILAGLFVIFLSVRLFLYIIGNMDYFNIKSVDIVSNTSFKIAGIEDKIVGKNIFKADLVKLKDYIQQKYPQLKFVRISRIVPDRLHVDVKSRISLFQFRFGSYYTLSEEGIVLMKLNNRVRGLIEVVGLDVDPKEFKIGAMLKSKRLKLAVSILKELYKEGLLKRHIVDTIDVTDPKNTTIIIEEYVEVRLGYKNFDKRIKALKEILADSDIHLKKIKYIDLRFKDAIIGPR